MSHPKVALVTGSTSGIGLALVQLFAKRGVNVIVTGSRARSLVESQLTDLNKYGVRVDYVQADLSKPSDVDLLWTEVTKLYQDGVDILVNNAAKHCRALADEFPDSLWHEMVAVNLTAPFMLTKRCLPGMKKKGWGRIVNVSSIAGVTVSPTGSLYAATKHGLIGFTKGVALENASNGITCNAVCPGLTDTNMLGEFAASEAKKMGISASQLVDSRLSLMPIQKLITPEQVAELVEFLCLSNASSQMTGASYLIDGGHVAR